MLFGGEGAHEHRGLNGKEGLGTLWDGGGREVEGTPICLRSALWRIRWQSVHCTYINSAASLRAAGPDSNILQKATHSHTLQLSGSFPSTDITK